MKSLVIVALLALSISMTMSLMPSATAKDLQTTLTTVKAQIEASDLTPKAKAFVLTTLVPLMTDPVVIEAVEAQNAKALSLEQIKATDEAWKKAEDPLPIQEALLTNKCAVTLKAYVAKHGAIAEVFAMDAQGANVCQNTMTSDYWQGDEDKFIKSFANGNGAAFVDKEVFDKSSQSMLRQISLPVVAPSGKVVGAFCAGIEMKGF